MDDIFHTEGTARDESGRRCRFISNGFFSECIRIHEQKTDVVSGLVNEEHPFHQAETRPGKAKKHRYERRKVRSILKVGDWGEETEYEEAS